MKCSTSRGDVRLALVQRGDADDDDAQAVVEVLAEIAFGNLRRKVLVGRGEHADIHFDVLVAAHAGEFLLLQDTQHLGLGGQAHIADFVQEEGAAVRLFELALVLLDGRGEGAFFVTEKFALYQFGGNGRAVDLDIGLRGPKALLVQVAGHQFLACSVGAGNEDAGVGRGDFVHHLAQGLHSLGSAHHPVRAAIDLGLENLGLVLQLGLVEGVPQGDEDAVEIEGLLQEVEGAAADAGDGRIDVAVTGHHHDRRIGSLFPQGGQKFHSVHSWHLDVTENDLEMIACDQLEGGLPVWSRLHEIIFIFKDFLEGIADRPFVIHNQYFCIVFHNLQIYLFSFKLPIHPGGTGIGARMKFLKTKFAQFKKVTYLCIPFENG